MIKYVYYDLFIKKLIFISLYKKKDISYEDIGYITNSPPQMIKLYDKELLSKKKIKELIRREGDINDQ